MGVALAASAFGQTDREEAKRVILGRGSNKGNTSSHPKDVILGGGNQTSTYPSGYPTTNGSRDQQIAQVNYEYDQKIQSVRNNGYLSAEEKARAIRQLEADRNRRIRQINKAYDDNRENKGKGKGNNGNHYGWEKGKGNPHKNGGKAKNKKWDDD